MGASLVAPMFTYAAPPAKPSGNQNGEPPSKPGNKDNSTPTYSAKTTISSDTTEDSKTYKSESGNENAILVNGGTSTLKNITLNKTGDSKDENADFYGTNAGIMVKSGTLNLSGGTITTNGSHANAVFSYGEGIIVLNDVSIKTSGNNSGGIMLAGGGTLTANNLSVETSGNSSAAIRSDRGGGTMNIDGGTYKTSGVGSPAIYSTADISVKDSKLSSDKSEGIVIEGANSVSLENVTLEDSNTCLNGNSETYKNIFIYQSMSGDASEGEGTFTAKNSRIDTENGDTFYVTNTKASINLNHNILINSNGNFMKIEGAKWGKSGSNGGSVTLNMEDQIATGGIIIDKISSLNMSIKSGSYYKGSINEENTTANITLKLSKDSTFVLDGDTYLTSLDNEDEDNSNIYLNGYKLYVGGKEVEANKGDAPDIPSYNNRNGFESESESLANMESKQNRINLILICGAIIIILGCGSLILTRQKRLDNRDE